MHQGADYVAVADTDNASTLTFTGPSVKDASNPEFGNSFELVIDSYDSGNGTFKYTVTNTATGEEKTDQNGKMGEAVNFGGISLTLEGTAEVGDSIDMTRGKDQSVFATLENALKALDPPEGTPPQDPKAKQADLSNTLSTVSRQLDNSLDNVLTVRASVGARLNELDVLDTVGGNRTLNYESTLSELVDLDYASAISDYTLRQVGLQASQKTFVDMRGMSLFEML